MAVLIDDKKLIPAPTVAINKNINLTDDGRPISSTYRITLEGTLLPNKGSPTSENWHIGEGEPASESFSTDAEKFESLLAKQELLREALGNPGFKFTYSSPSNQPVECYPVVNSINVTPGRWVIRSDYSIELETETLDKEGSRSYDDCFIANASGLNLSSISDEWQVNERPDNPDIFEVTRNVSATARTSYTTGAIVGTEAWRNAKTWVDDRLTNYSLSSGDTRFVIPSGNDSLYNTVQEETIDRFGGTYSVNTRYIYAVTGYVEQRNVTYDTQYNLINNSGVNVVSITVQGTIEGLDANNDPSGKLSNALTYWSSISGGLGSAVGANGDPVSLNWTENEDAGTIDYSVQFTNNSGSTHSHTYDVRFESSQQGEPIVVIAGQVQGFSDDALPQGGVPFTNAKTIWTGYIEDNLKSLAFAEPSIFGGSNYGNNFANTPVNKVISFNKANGTINYEYSYGYKVGDSSNDYIDRYSVEYSTDNIGAATDAGLIVNASINGEIIGIDPSGDLDNKFANALDGWTGGISGDLYTRVNTDFAYIGGNKPGLYSGTLSRTVGIDRIQGRISYSATYSNLPEPSSSTNVAAMDVTVEDGYKSDIFAVHQIVGRTSGPIIQSLGAKSDRTKTINVALTMKPNSGNHWTWADKDTPRNIASGIIYSDILLNDWGTRGGQYFVTADSDSWDWRNGLYTATVAAILRT